MFLLNDNHLNPLILQSLLKKDSHLVLMIENSFRLTFRNKIIRHLKNKYPYNK